jgi:hypothetical protein
MKKFLFLLPLISILACCETENADPTNEGQIKVFVCTRGCYQYLLEVDGVFYSPNSLPETLKRDGQAVRFEGEPLDGTTTIYKPAPNDVPVPDFEAQNFNITNIEAI